MSSPKILFAGDRKIAVDVLRFLTNTNADVSALLLPAEDKATHDQKIRSLCPDIDNTNIIRGTDFKKQDTIKHLESINPDYLISVHFQHIFPKSVLEIPEYDPINLHPAYLPYNRGWHTPSWAIWEQTPYGATLHVMTENLDSGDIINRKRIYPRPDDTANTLYQRALEAELELFKRTWPSLSDFNYETTPQSEADATAHTKSDLDRIRHIDLDESVLAGEMIRKLRSLTTNDISEAAYFEQDGKQYRIQINIVAKRNDE